MRHPVVLSRVPGADPITRLWDARIYACRVGNPFARRPNFYRKVATIPRQFGNEQGGARDGSCPGRSAAHFAERCAAEPGPSRTLVLGTVPVLRSSASRSATRCIAPGTSNSRSPDAAQRAALAERCAAEPGSRFSRDGLNRGPGSAKQRFAKCYALHRARDTQEKNGCRFWQPPFEFRVSSRSVTASRTGTSGGLLPCRISCVPPRGSRG
jgi:hypothetical protein